jgi:hypothetical protein
MKDVRAYTLASEIEDEIKKIEELVKENEEVCRQIKEGEEFDFLKIRGQGAIIHDFYTAFEKIFKKIATDINGELPPGEDWHQRLLYQMSIEVKGVRPAVISKESFSFLKQLLAFRHLFRNVYGFELKKDRLDELSNMLLEKGRDVLEEVDKFTTYLRKLIIEE